MLQKLLSAAVVIGALRVNMASIIHFYFSEGSGMPFQFNIVDCEATWKTVQILIRWLCQKPADLDLLCFLKRKYLGSAGQGLI